MQLRGIRLWLVITVCAVTLALLLGGRWFYQQRLVENNLVNELQAVPGVVSAKILEQGNLTKVEVQLAGVRDLRQAYREIQETVSRVYDPSRLRVEIVNKEHPALDETWSRVQFSVYQALMQGNFTDMAQAIDRETSRAGVISSVQMDWDYVYIQFQQDDHYSYHVIPRRQQDGSRAASGSFDQAGGGV